MSQRSRLIAVIGSLVLAAAATSACSATESVSGDPARSASTVVAGTTPHDSASGSADSEQPAVSAHSGPGATVPTAPPSNDAEIPAYFGNVTIGASGIPVPIAGVDSVDVGSAFAAPADGPDAGLAYVVSRAGGQSVAAGENPGPGGGTTVFTIDGSTVVRKQELNCGPTESSGAPGFFAGNAVAMAPEGTPNSGAIYLPVCQQALLMVNPSENSSQVIDLTDALAASGHIHPDGLYIATSDAPNPGTVTILGSGIQIAPSGDVHAEHDPGISADARILAVVPAGLPDAGALVIEDSDGRLLLEDASHTATVLAADKAIRNDVVAVVAPAELPNAGTIYVSTSASLIVVAPDGDVSVLRMPGGYPALELAGSHRGRLVVLDAEHSDSLTIRALDADGTISTIVDLPASPGLTWESVFGQSAQPEDLYWALRALVDDGRAGLPFTRGLGGKLYAADRDGVVVVSPDGTATRIPL